MVPLDIEALIVSYLSGLLSCSVVSQIPPTMPSKLVTVERTGGGGNGINLDSPSVAIQCYDATKYASSSLARTVADYMDSFVYEDGIQKVVRNTGPYWFPDTERELPRYQIYYNITTS